MRISLGLAHASFLVACAMPLAAATWSIEGAELRQRHADTLEDLLREVPFLRVDRFGASSLPFQIGLDAQRTERICLLLDGVLFADAWSGENLFEELPLSLLEKVEVDLTPAPVEFGSEALAGVIRVWTRRQVDPKVETRIHLSRASLSERSRRLSFETPPGDLALAVGLDEFFSDGYAFSQVWGGEDAAAAAAPEVSGSRRRVLLVRLDLDGAALGPIEGQLLQSDWRMDLSSGETDHWRRDLYQANLNLPATPLGSVILVHRGLERRSRQWRSLDSVVSARWDLPRWRILGGPLDLASGARRHQLGASVDGEKQGMPRPTELWLYALWGRDLPAAIRLEAGIRLEAERQSRRRLLYQARLAWSDEAKRRRLSLFAAGGDGCAPWRYERLDDLLVWPGGISEPDRSAPGSLPLRTGFRFDGQWKRIWFDLQVWRESGGGLWFPLDAGGGRWQWDWTEQEDQTAAVVNLGSRWSGRPGRIDTWLSLLADLDGPHSSTAFQTGYPHQGRWQLLIGRSFFDTDAWLSLGGGVEYRGGFEDHAPMFLIDLEAELRVLQARFWLRFRNALDWAGEEIPGYPIPPAAIHMGMDWHLDH